MKTIILLVLSLLTLTVHAWEINNVFDNVAVNVTSPGSYQDQAAGYYSGGGFSMRTKSKTFQPFAATPPSLSMGCSGIDMFAGSFSIFQGQELINLAKNIGSQAATYGFQLALKTFSPQIESLLSHLRDMAMQLNQFSVEECRMTQSLFAAALPKDSASYEEVCKDLQQSSGNDYFQARNNCKKHQDAKKAVKQAEQQQPDLLLANYNLLIKAADKAGIPRSMSVPMMSLLGTIVANNGDIMPYESLAKDEDTWNAHVRGGHASSYACKDKDCLSVELQAMKEISEKNSYRGQAGSKLESLRNKMQFNQEFNQEDISFINSIGETLPIYNYLSFEAVSGEHLIDKSSDLVANYLILNYLQKIINEIRQALYILEAKQINNQHLKDYLESLDQIQIMAQYKYQNLIKLAHHLEKRARYLEAHQLAKMRG